MPGLYAVSSRTVVLLHLWELKWVIPRCKIDYRRHTGKNLLYSSPSSVYSLALFSSRPPSSRTRPEYGYSRGTVGLSGTSAHLHRSPKAMNPEAAKENWNRAFRGGTCGMSGPHIERTSSYSWIGSPKFRLCCWSHHPRVGRLWLDTHGSSG